MAYRKYFFIIFIITVSSTFSKASLAANFDKFVVGDLVSECEKALLEEPESFECIAYFQGLRDGYKLRESADSETAFCVPPEIKTLELIRLVVYSFEKQDEILALPASYGIVSALADAFPCKP